MITRKAAVGLRIRLEINPIAATRMADGAEVDGGDDNAEVYGGGGMAVTASGDGAAATRLL